MSLSRTRIDFDHSPHTLYIRLQVQAPSPPPSPHVHEGDHCFSKEIDALQILVAYTDRSEPSQRLGNLYGFGPLAMRSSS